MNYGLSAKINSCEMPHCVQRLWTHFVCVFSRLYGQQKKPITSNWSFMADIAITRGGIGVQGSPFYVCGQNTGSWEILNKSYSSRILQRNTNKELTLSNATYQIWQGSFDFIFREAAGRPKCPVDPFFIVPDKCQCVDFQTLKLQESPEAVPNGEMPRHVQLYCDR